MKTFISKLITLADGLDHLGLKKDADKIDQLILWAGRDDEGRDPGEFGELSSLFDEPDSGDKRHRVELEGQEDEGVPIRTRLTEVPENFEVLTDLEPDEPVSRKKPTRLDELKRRHEMLKLKKSLDEPDEEELPPELHGTRGDEPFFPDNDSDLPTLNWPVMPEVTPESFEDEDEDDDEEDDENDADDSLLDELKEKLKGVPDLAKQLLTLVRDNPELLELLAL